MHAIGLLLVLYVLWLLLSGHYVFFLLLIGAVCAVAVMLFALRMEVVDHESYPLHLRIPRLVGYWGWLLKEIALANVDVARRVLDPALPISPTVFRVPASQRSAVGRVIYANSITLTPGTVSIDVTDDEIEVHALSRELAEGLTGGGMDRRVAGLEGRI